MSLENGSEN